MSRRLALVAALVVWGCAPRPAIHRPPWAAYVGDGPLSVRGAAWNAPGPTIFRALAADPDTRAVVAARGEPETLRVVCGRAGGTRVILRYRGPREVVAAPDDAAGVCGPPPRERARVAASPRRDDDASRSGVAPVAAAPTPRQQLECPIDPTRADCRVLCAADGGHEWCR